MSKTWIEKIKTGLSGISGGFFGSEPAEPLSQNSTVPHELRLLARRADGGESFFVTVSGFGQCGFDFACKNVLEVRDELLVDVILPRAGLTRLHGVILELDNRQGMYCGWLELRLTPTLEQAWSRFVLNSDKSRY